MKILVACEESQAVTKEFRALGHEAYSCDILPCSGGHPEWHIQGDVLPLLNGNCTFKVQDNTEGKKTIWTNWDMIIAFPPCTYITNAGAVHLYGKRHNGWNEKRYQKGLEAKEFFLKFYNADCPKIAIENPTPSGIYKLPPHSQVIQPYEFGHPTSKRTQLWLKGLPLLQPTNIVEINTTTKIAGNWFNKGGKDRAINRSKTFLGIAKAMATQWSNN